jgi:hypothetical protein
MPMADGVGRVRRIVAVSWPAGAIFCAWGIVNEIAQHGRSVSPDVIGTGWFQKLAALVQALTLAAGWLVALRSARRTRGRVRIPNTAFAILFALLCAGSAASHIWVSQTMWSGVAQMRETMSRPQPKLAGLFDRAWTGKDAASREFVARTIYMLKGVRIGYRGETGAGQLYEPTAELVQRDARHRKAEEEMRSLLAFMATNAEHVGQLAYPYLLGLVVMLAGSLGFCMRSGRPLVPPVASNDS